MVPNHKLLVVEIDLGHVHSHTNDNGKASQVEGTRPEQAGEGLWKQMGRKEAAFLRKL